MEQEGELMAVELKPCPFCNHKAHLVRGALGGELGEVRCTWCGVQTHPGMPVEVAIRIWNTRAEKTD